MAKTLSEVEKNLSKAKGDTDKAALENLRLLLETSNTTREETTPQAGGK